MANSQILAAVLAVWALVVLAQHDHRAGAKRDSPSLTNIPRDYDLAEALYSISYRMTTTFLTVTVPDGAWPTTLTPSGYDTLLAIVPETSAIEPLIGSVVATALPYSLPAPYLPRPSPSSHAAGWDDNTSTDFVHGYVPSYCLLRVQNEQTTTQDDRKTRATEASPGAVGGGKTRPTEAPPTPTLRFVVEEGQSARMDVTATSLDVAPDFAHFFSVTSAVGSPLRTQPVETTPVGAANDVPVDAAAIETRQVTITKSGGIHLTPKFPPTTMPTYQPVAPTSKPEKI